MQSLLRSDLQNSSIRSSIKATLTFVDPRGKNVDILLHMCATFEVNCCSLSRVVNPSTLDNSFAGLPSIRHGLLQNEHRSPYPRGAIRRTRRLLSNIRGRRSVTISCQGASMGCDFELEGAVGNGRRNREGGHKYRKETMPSVQCLTTSPRGERRPTIVLVRDYCLLATGLLATVDNDSPFSLHCDFKLSTSPFVTWHTSVSFLHSSQP